MDTRGKEICGETLLRTVRNTTRSKIDLIEQRYRNERSQAMGPPQFVLRAWNLEESDDARHIQVLNITLSKHEAMQLSTGLMEGVLNDREGLHKRTPEGVDDTPHRFTYDKEDKRWSSEMEVSEEAEPVEGEPEREPPTENTEKPSDEIDPQNPAQH